MGKCFSKGNTGRRRAHKPVKTKNGFEGLSSVEESRGVAYSQISTVEEEKVVQMVLYGPCEAGKTTFAHRMMVFHGHDLSSEKDKWRPIICFNVLEGVNLIVNNGMKIHGMKLTDSKETEACAIILEKFNYFKNNIPACSLNDDENLINCLLFLVDNSSMFKELIASRSTFSLFDSWLYFVEKLRNYPTWGGDSWVPDIEDILRAKSRTISAKPFTFIFNEQKFVLTDLDSQKSERAMRVVHNMSLDCLIFFVSLADYDEVLLEDHTGSRLTESLRLWKSCVLNEDFQSRLIILVLNKLDIFKRKYFFDRTPIALDFAYNVKPPLVEDEEGNPGCPKAVQWFVDLYRNQAPSVRRNDIKVFVTDLFDEENLKEDITESLTYIQNNVK